MLRLPLGLRWVARHSGYEPPERFVDELVSAPPASVDASRTTCRGDHGGVSRMIAPVRSCQANTSGRGCPTTLEYVRPMVPPYR